MKPTIRDVAKLAGVSPATVSRVMNRPELVEGETKDRVREAMEVLNFQPNLMARGLGGRRTHTLGVVVPGITDFFFNELYRGIDRAAHAHGMKVLLYDCQHSRHRALEGFTFLKQHQVEGIIFTSKLVTEDYDPVLERLGIPVVLVLTESVAKTPLTAYKVDDLKAVFDAVSYLVSRGHKKIAMISGILDGESTGPLRLQGYRAALEHFGIEVDESLIAYGDYRFSDGYAAMQRLLADSNTLPFTAVCAASDEMALGAMRCLYDNGYSIPNDVSVVGFDDLSIAQMSTPTLTTVAQPFQVIAENAVDWLMNQIQVGQPIQPNNGVYLLPHRLVERESVRTISRL